MLCRIRGDRKGVLARGEQKSIQTDRVILVPGPSDEVDTVRWMYHAFADEGKMESEIATQLNERGCATDLGRAWPRQQRRQTSNRSFQPAIWEISTEVPYGWNEL
jgi:hypothetical protein